MQPVIHELSPRHFAVHVKPFRHDGSSARQAFAWLEHLSTKHVWSTNELSNPLPPYLSDSSFSANDGVNESDATNAADAAKVANILPMSGIWVDFSLEAPPKFGNCKCRAEFDPLLVLVMGADVCWFTKASLEYANPSTRAEAIFELALTMIAKYMGQVMFREICPGKNLIQPRRKQRGLSKSFWAGEGLTWAFVEAWVQKRISTW